MNELLRLTCNRETGFSSPVFPLESDFTPAPTTADLQAVRRILGLLPGMEDWYVVGALMTVKQFPTYLNLVGEHQRTYTLEDYVRPADVFSGGSLQPDRSGPPAVCRQPIEWPIQFKTFLLYHSPTTAILHAAGQINTLEIRPQGNRVLFGWPTHAGIRGELHLDQPWHDESNWAVWHAPAYPHALVADRLTQSPAVQAILQTATLAGAFYGADSPAEKVAITVTALALVQREQTL